jgi:hypothetical protein
VSELSFISPGAVRVEDGYEPRVSSPLQRALAGSEGIGDLSPLGKLEVRRADVGALATDGDVIRITPTRALVICPPERCAEVRSSLPGVVVDVSGALAGIEVQGVKLMRRLTDLDLSALPSAGKVAGVQAVVTRSGDSFRIFFAQEYGDSVVEFVRDVQDGLA